MEDPRVLTQSVFDHLASASPEMAELGLHSQGDIERRGLKLGATAEAEFIWRATGDCSMLLCLVEKHVSSIHRLWVEGHVGLLRSGGHREAEESENSLRKAERQEALRN